MKHGFKRALSLLMVLALICAFAIVPASAATADVALELRNGSWSGNAYTVDVYAVADSGEIANYKISVEYDANYLECTNVVAIPGGYGGVTTPNVGTASMGGISVPGVPFTSEGVGLGRFTFTMKDGVEKVRTTLTAKCTEMGNDSSEAYSNIENGVESVNVPGSDPTIETVALSANSFTATGTTGGSTQATATSAKGTNITGVVAWSVDPAGQGVTVDDEGAVTVDPKAKAGTYTVKADAISGQSLGSGSATLTVARNNPEVTTVEVSGPSTITVPKTAETHNSTAEYTAKVLDQYDEVMEGKTVTWRVSSADGVSISDNVVTVAYGAAKGTDITVTATCEGTNVSGTKTVGLVDILVTPVLKNNGNVVYGDKWSDIVTGVTAKLGEDNVPGTFTVENAGVMPGAGEGRTTNVTFKSTDGVYEVTVPVTVNVAKRAITITLDPQKKDYNGEPQTVGNVEYTGAEVVDGATLICVPTEEVTQTDAGTYEVEYTCESENYIVTVKGGALVINKKSMDLDSDKVVDKITLGGLTLTQKEDGTLGLTVPSGTKERDLLKDLKSANKDLVFSVSGDDGTIYEFTIEDWVLVGEFDSKGYNEFAPVLVGVDAASDAFLKNHAPNVPHVVVRISTTGGSGGGSSSGVWGDRGNQTINLTPTSIFTDVPDGYTFQTDIMWVYYRGVMKGTSATTFSPYSNTNRQQLWMVLGRLSGSNPGDMATARAWAINTGVSDGSNATGSLTRQQMVTMLYRWAQSKGYTGVTTGSISGYADASSVASYARDAMAWAVGNGILHGSGNTLMPNGTATRAQFAAIMHRFCEKFGV